MLGGAQVGRGDLHPEHTLTFVAYDVERFRTANRPSNRLTVPAAFTCDDCSHRERLRLFLCPRFGRWELATAVLTKSAPNGAATASLHHRDDDHNQVAEIDLAAA